MPPAPAAVSRRHAPPASEPPATPIVGATAGVDESAEAEAARALAGHLHFAPDAGHIRLFDQRMLLMHAEPFAELRRELIVSLGMAKARALLTRLGYQQGFADGQHVRQGKLREGDGLAAVLSLGPRLREIEGFVRNQPVEAMRVDVDRGEFWGDYYWSASWEAQAHLAHCGVGSTPGCWTMVGYADGYSTAVTGLPIHWREVECVACGHARCRVIGRPLSEWAREGLDDTVGSDRPDGDAAGGEASTAYLRIDTFVGTPAPRPAPAGAGPGSVKPTDIGGFVGASAGFNAVAHRVRKVAPTDSTVLFRGESGVGKECFARALHSISPRAAQPFIALNCAAIPADLVEAELFGVERGAYTGADRTRPGRFERADGGTLFLDEITSLPLPAQGKLLRVLQEREYERVGGTELRQVDVRIVAAANVDLREEMAAGRFRRDLFYRLNVFPVEIPPLRERLEDLPLLVALFLERSARRCRKRVPGLTAAAYAALWDYDWPGNVRELENMIERGVILAEPEGSIDVHHLFAGGEQRRGATWQLGPGSLVSSSGAAATASSADDPERQALVDRLLDAFPSFEALETELLTRAVDRCDGNVSAVARLLRLRRGQVEYRLKKRQDPARD